MTLLIGEMTLGSKLKKGGFTLIELVLVILLVSIITALSTPLFRRTFSDLTIKNASFDMSKMINYTQEMAIIDRVTYKLNLSFEKKSYWITKETSSEKGTIYKRIKGRFGKAFFLPRGYSLKSGKKELMFYPDGRSDEAKIRIRDEKSRNERIIEVKGFGGRVTVKAAK